MALSRKVRTQVVLLFLVMAGVCSMFVFAAIRPVYRADENTSLCATCGMQSLVTSRRLLFISLPHRTNETATPISAILSANPPVPCIHNWRLANTVGSSLALRPLPLGETVFQIHLDLSGIADQKTFLEALQSIAATDLGTARGAWSNLVSAPVPQLNLFLARLKKTLETNSSPEELRHVLTNDLPHPRIIF